MSVGNVGAAVDSMVLEYYRNKPKQKLDFKQAVEDYEDEMITGLTKEEREAIDAILKKYMEENPGDIEGYKNLLKGLLKKFGFKGNIDAYTDPDLIGAGKGAVDNSAASVMAQETVSNMLLSQQADIKSTVETITDENGDAYVIVKMNNYVSFKMKVSGENSDADGQDVKSKLDAYEKNIAFS